ncbi:unnamed protein product [Closterium sp. NIES-64]|nr:unnamed protein product [Closterium sp. NIES-64]CAI5963981.1 unnamed protein product [Closterium sp. NIES-65]
MAARNSYHHCPGAFRNNQLPETNRHAELARLAAKLKDLFEREKFTDVVFEAADGTKIRAHRNIVALWSPVLESMLEDAADERDQVFKLADVDGHTMRLLLAFMYGFDMTPNVPALKTSWTGSCQQSMWKSARSCEC